MLKKMNKCQCQNEWYVDELHPEFKKYPHLCPWCHGKGEWEGVIHLYDYEGKFDSLNYDDVKDTHDDFYYSFICEHCDDDIALSEGGDTVACKCGRIYRLSVSIKVDTSHIGDIDFIIQESNRKEET